MIIDYKWAKLLSDFFLDLAKAFFIAVFISPSTEKIISFYDLLFLLTKGIVTVIMLLIISRMFLDYYEPTN